MLFAILCYDRQDVVWAWTKEKDDALMVKLDVVQRELKALGKLGPVARLMPTTQAVTVRSAAETLVVDGPFAETKEQLLGFFIVDFDSLDEAVAVTKRLLHESGSMEIRPVRMFRNPEDLT
jgi:hypothetical protein